MAVILRDNSKHTLLFSWEYIKQIELIFYLLFLFKIITFMFIIRGDRRINLLRVKEYKPIQKIIEDKVNFFVEFIYDDDTKTEFNFFGDEKWRDKMIITIDKMCLNKSEE